MSRECEFHHRIQSDMKSLPEDPEIEDAFGDLFEQVVLMPQDGPAGTTVVCQKPVPDGIYLVLKLGMALACIARRDDARTVLLHLAVANSKRTSEDAIREGYSRYMGYTWPEKGTSYAT